MTAALAPHPPSDLRPYQRAAIDAVLAARRAGRRRLLVHLPTGAGKTVIFAHLAKLARRQVLVLAHREELLTQARDKLVRALGGDAVVEIERGALRASAEAKVLVCSIRSLHEERLARVLRGRDVGLIVYDECHHAAAEDNLRVLRQLGVFEPAFDGTLLGFTATTARGDGQGLDDVFEEVVYTRALPELIDDGYLAPLRGFRISTTADLRKLSPAGLDYDEEELAEAIDIEERNALVARSIQELARDRRTIAFCVTVNHARHLAHALNALGVPTGIVHGAMPGAGARADPARLSRGAHAGPHQRGRLDRRLRRSGRVVRRDGAAHALGGAVRPVRGARDAPLPRQDRLPDPGLRRSDDAESVHVAVPVRHAAGSGSARGRRERGAARVAAHRVRSAGLRAGGGRGHARGDPGPRRQLRSADAAARRGRPRDLDQRLVLPGPARPGAAFSATAPAA